MPRLLGAATKEQPHWVQISDGSYGALDDLAITVEKLTEIRANRTPREARRADAFNEGLDLLSLEQSEDVACRHAMRRRLTNRLNHVERRRMQRRATQLDSDFVRAYVAIKLPGTRAGQNRRDSQSGAARSKGSRRGGSSSRTSSSDPGEGGEPDESDGSSPRPRIDSQGAAR